MPIPPLADLSPEGSRNAPRGFREWSRRAGGDDGPGRSTIAGQPGGIAVAAPLLKVAAAAALGYALGAILLRRSAPPTPAQPGLWPVSPPPGPTRRDASSLRFR